MLHLPPASLFRPTALVVLSVFYVVLSGVKAVGQANDFSLPTDPLTHAAELSAAVDDQSLNAIAPASADRLVAVGDVGVILVSENAGRSWTRIRNGDPSSLSGLAFLSAEVGIAVGGRVGSFTRTSEATVIQTQDGGFNWKRLETDLPRLRGIQNQNGRLIAWGDYSVKHRSAVFVSVDQGMSWTAIPVVGVTHVRTAHQSVAGDLIVVDRSNRAHLRLQSGAVMELKSLQDVESVHHSGREWLAVGRRGKVLKSQDGQVWSTVPLPLESSERILCDWSSIAQVGQHIWVGGFPGSLLLHSKDLGNSWSREAIEQSLPIHDICFLDEARGWSVGPLGTIRATRNGSNWFAQRNADKGAGVLCLTPSIDAVPWAAMAGCAWDKGVTCAVQLMPLTDENREQGFLPSLETCLADALGKVGVAQATSIVAAESGEQFDAEYLKQRLHLALQAWRPSIVVVATDDGVDTWSMQANSLLDAARMFGPSGLGGESGFPQELWKVEKVVQTVPVEQAQYTER
ncbi:MAG: YCF48-related protein, partial [Pseudomonadota bacterium]